MANLFHLPKSCDDWGLNDLDSYHISLNQMDAASFFDLPVLPQPSVDDELLNYEKADAMQQTCNLEVIGYLDFTETPMEEEDAVIDFVKVLLKLCNGLH